MGSTVGVDAYCWLHKGIHGEITWNKPYVEYCIKRVRMLKKFNVRPLIVFDGGYLPAKYRIELIREQKRQEYSKIGRELFKKGRVRESFPFLKRSVDVTPDMAHKFIEALRAENVEYVVAPYEADAQLAYLEKKKHIAAIITEDSDLLVFGCKTVIYKLELNGNGIEICRDKFGDVEEINMLGWTDKKFRHMSMLAGCDYLPSIPGIGIKSAHKYLRKYETVDKVIQYLKGNNKVKVPPNYENDFKKAELVFLYQRVFDIETERLVTLNPVSEDLDISLDTDYIGSNMDKNIALGIAIGDINPITMKPIIQAKENVVEARNLLPPYSEIDFLNVNDPFTCNPFDLVKTTTSQENTLLIDSLEKNGQGSISPANKNQKIFTNLTEFIEPIKMYRGNFSTINSDGMKQTNYHSNAELTECERLVAEGWAYKYSRKRKWDNK
ncbi:PIN domain-like protein [Rhizophagus irregularis DAOM 181602=DAOM 197198]|uniref:Exo1p n=1 Tax=Rhizophagus irregularis (strain DAOM 197198w) TaxID=1432141 RepID=A0A015IPT1_RHIIW|nr:Exo1p [Rhizophagus irregularis DAOM 197198w]GBC49202.2 PIN domain-like protein [Rhizophagus irregularis DAOM 181602=DAOM 197198]